ncbi:hypothetical protein H9L10_13120 [Phycicoccus endophyticus]|uniref:Uncharacterized protein n=1 Tax=Phycicoccus endophyticus TaxID=1690220 RepID=A0A7G9R0N2_9MICO|nr:hypothetical protein [Phycicoccus endophyticus]NHI19438.1 hypothetical protein [Phycicoccus endophyticus]QNN49157.1 hypothetical protein H9L10_13120 [Phycicoccus endophyticus]GGL39194.1 hypothetical protein GCM10012283_22070 [Phycicoccus endophyticus]
MQSRGVSTLARPVALLAAAALVACACLWYLVRPPRTVGEYRQEAHQTLASLASEVATARMWADHLDRGDAPLTTTRLGLAEMESDATEAVRQFEAYQPPVGAASVRARVSGLGGRSVAALAQLRIAARSGRPEEVVRRGRDLRGLSRDLEAATRAVAP